MLPIRRAKESRPVAVGAEVMGLCRPLYLSSLRHKSRQMGHRISLGHSGCWQFLTFAAAAVLAALPVLLADQHKQKSQYVFLFP